MTYQTSTDWTMIRPIRSKRLSHVQHRDPDEPSTDDATRCRMPNAHHAERRSMYRCYVHHDVRCEMRVTINHSVGSHYSKSKHSNMASRNVKIVILTLCAMHMAGAFLPHEGANHRGRSLRMKLFPSDERPLKAEGRVSRRQVLDTSFAAAASGLLLPKYAMADENIPPSSPKATIPTVTLGGGKSSLRISRTIQGYWQLAGGHGIYREVDATENMQAHYDAGITTLDTADIYGPSELIVGKFVKSQPGAIPCTKFCCFRYLEVSFQCHTNFLYHAHK
jgi:hypothetical protein